MKTLLALSLLVLAHCAPAAPVILSYEAVNPCGGLTPDQMCPSISVVSTQAAGTVLTLEVSRDGGLTWEFTGSSAGVATFDQTTKLTYGFQRFTDIVPLLMFRTLEY